MSEDSLNLIRRSYDWAEQCDNTGHYRSGETFFAHSTLVAFSVARMGRGPEAIAAALMHKLDTTQRARMHAELGTDPLTTDFITTLIEGLEARLNEPFNPRIETIYEDSTLDNFLQRQLVFIDGQAQKLEDQWRREGILDADALQTRMDNWRGSMLCLDLADKWQTVATILPGTDPESYRQLANEVKLLHAAQADRFGLPDIAEAMLDDSFGALYPSVAQQNRVQFEEETGLSRDQEERMLADLVMKTKTYAKRHHVSPLFVEGRFHPVARSIEELNEQGEYYPFALEPRTRTLTVVVETPEQLRAIRSLDTHFGKVLSQSAWTQLEQRSPIDARRPPQLLGSFTVAPSGADRRATVSLEIWTRDAYERHLHEQYGRIREWPWQNRLRESAQRIAKTSLGRNASWNLRFDHQDPPLQFTAHRERDLDENLNRVRRTLSHHAYPIFPVNEEGRLDVHAGKEDALTTVHWGITCLPRGALAADWVFGPYVLGTPEEHVVPVRIPIYRDPKNTEKTAYVRQDKQRKYLELTDEIGPVDILFGDPDVNLEPSPGAIIHLLRSTSGVQTTRGKLVASRPLSEESQVQSNLGAKLLKATDSVEKEFGPLDPVFLNRMARWFGLLGFAELAEALAKGILELKFVRDAFGQRFVAPYCHDPIEQDAYYDMRIEFDPGYPEIFPTLLRRVRQTGWGFFPDITFDPEPGTAGRMDLKIRIKKRPGADIGGLTKTLQTIRIPRQSADAQALQETTPRRQRLLRFDMRPSSEGFERIVQCLTDLHMGIASLRRVPNQSAFLTWSYELVLLGPDTSTARDEAVEQRLTDALDRLRLKPKKFSLSPTDLLMGGNWPLIVNSEIVDFDDLVHFEAEWHSPPNQDFYELVFSNTPDQKGITHAVAGAILQHHGNLTGGSRLDSFEAGALGVFRVAKQALDGQPLDRDGVVQEIKNLRIRREPPRPSRPTRRLTLHARLENAPGAFYTLTGTLKEMDISIQNFRHRTEQNEEYWDMVLEAPQTLSDNQLLTHLTGIEHLTRIELTPKDISEAAAERALHFLNQEIAAIDKNQQAPRGKFAFADKELTKQDREFLLDLEQTYRLAQRLHYYQRRHSGLDYTIHLLEVTRTILRDYGVRDPIILIASLLHDAEEDAVTHIQDDEIRVAKNAPIEAQQKAWEAIQEVIREELPRYKETLLHVIHWVTVIDPRAYDQSVKGLLDVGVVDVIALKFGDRGHNSQDQWDKNRPWRADKRYTRPPEPQPAHYGAAHTQNADTLRFFPALLMFTPRVKSRVYREAWGRFFFDLMRDSIRRDEGDGPYRLERLDLLIQETEDDSIRETLAWNIQDFINWIEDPANAVVVRNHPEFNDQMLKEFLARLNDLLDHLLPPAQLQAAMDLQVYPYQRDWRHPWQTLRSLIVTGIRRWHEERHRQKLKQAGMEFSEDEMSGHSGKISFHSSTDVWRTLKVFLAGPAIDLAAALGLLTILGGTFYGMGVAIGPITLALFAAFSVYSRLGRRGFTPRADWGLVGLFGGLLGYYGHTTGIGWHLLPLLLLIPAYYFAIAGTIGSRHDWSVIQRTRRLRSRSA